MQRRISCVLLTRRQYMSYSELQAGAGSRRSAQVMVIPLASAATRGQRLPEAPNLLIVNDRPSHAGPWTALEKLAVGELQRRFSILPRTSTRRLNTIYIVDGLIITTPITSLASLIGRPVWDVKFQ